MYIRRVSYVLVERYDLEVMTSVEYHERPGVALQFFGLSH